MYRLGFCHKWTQLIMKCVSSVKYRIKGNGELSNELIPERGLGQGGSLVSISVSHLCRGIFSLVEPG
jgi:hypothetical protein